MGGFLPAPMSIPGYSGAQPERGRGSHGPRFGGGPYQGGMPPPQAAAQYPTPMANQIVEGINNFINSVKDVREGEKEAAKKRFFQAVEMANLGLTVDLKKAARDARKAGLPFDFGEDSGPGPGKQPTGGMPPPQQPGGQAPGQPQGNALQRIGSGIKNAMMPPPTPEVPDNAPIMDNLRQIQQSAQMKMQMEKTRDKAVSGVMTKKRGSPEWNEDVATVGMLQKLQGNGDIEDIPEHQIFKMANTFGKSEQEVRDRLWAMKSGMDPKERVKMATPFILKGIPAEEALTAIDGIMAGETDVQLSLPEDEKESSQEVKKRIDYWRARFPGAATQQLHLAALYDSTENYAALDALIDKMGPSVEEKAEARAESGEARAARGEGRAVRAEGRAETEEGRRETKDWVSYTASSILAEIGDPQRALDALNKIAKGSTKIRANLIPLEKAIKNLEGPKTEVTIQNFGSSEGLPINANE